MLVDFLGDEKKKQLYINYPKVTEHDPSSIQDQIGYLMDMRNGWLIDEYGIKEQPRIYPKKSVYKGFPPVEGYERFEGIFNFEKYRAELEQEFKEVAVDEYTEAFHTKVLKMIPGMLFEMRVLIMRKMAEVFGIEDKFATITKPIEITDEMKRLERLMLDTWEMVVVRRNVETERELWGENSDAEEIFYYFEIFEVLEGVKEELGRTVDAEFYAKAIKITDRIKTARIEKIREYLNQMEGTTIVIHK
ncbi:MAG: hypothetical protein ACFFC6_11470 [Promethearchaeota archaeon]